MTDVTIEVVGVEVTATAADPASTSILAAVDGVEATSVAADSVSSSLITVATGVEVSGEVGEAIAATGATGIVHANVYPEGVEASVEIALLDGVSLAQDAFGVEVSAAIGSLDYTAFVHSEISGVEADARVAGPLTVDTSGFINANVYPVGVQATLFAADAIPALTETVGDHIFERVFAYINFDSGAVRVHDGYGDITWGGNTWSGLGEFGGISRISEASDIGPRAISLRLTGVDLSTVASALDRTDYKGRDVEIYVGSCDSDGDLLADPDLFWKGYADVASLSFGKNTAEIELSCENELADLLEANINRFSDEDHQLRYPGDLFFEHLAFMEGREIKWGQFYYSGNFGHAGPGGDPNFDSQDRIK